MAMLIGEMHHDGPRSWSHAEMNAHTIDTFQYLLVSIIPGSIE